jgi:hypothetical protein
MGGERDNFRLKGENKMTAINKRIDVLESLVGQHVYLVRPGQYSCCGKREKLSKVEGVLFHGENRINPREVLTIHEFDGEYRIGLFNGDLEAPREFQGPCGIVRVDAESCVDENDRVTRNLLGEIEFVEKGVNGDGMSMVFSLTATTGEE